MANPCDTWQGALLDPEQVLALSPELVGVILGDPSSISMQWMCVTLEVFAQGLESDGGICTVITVFAYLCSCNDGAHSYLGADTKIAKNPQHKKSLRRQFLFGLSIGDIIGYI